MAHDPTMILQDLSGQTPRRYSTFDFGRSRDEQCLSVIVPEADARLLVFHLRELLPAGLVAFVGTTRWLGDEKHKDQAEVVVGRGTSQFDILRLARSDAVNYGMETEELVKKLENWHRSVGIDIFHAETDTIEFTLAQLPADLHAFAEDVYAFCPDTVEQGVGSVDALERSIRDSRSVYLWWD